MNMTEIARQFVQLAVEASEYLCVEGEKYTHHIDYPTDVTFSGTLTLFLRDYYLEPSDYDATKMQAAIRYIASYSEHRFEDASGLASMLHWVIVEHRLDGDKAERIHDLIDNCIAAL